MNTLKCFATMVGNRQNRSGTVLGVFALSVALLFAIEGHAQSSNYPLSFVNLFTAGALDNGDSTLDGSQLKTSVWLGANSPTRQKWQIFYDDGAAAIGRISSLNSFKVADVASHCALSPFPVVQADGISMNTVSPACNSRQPTLVYRFQRWEFTRLGRSSYFIVKNAATGMCLTDIGDVSSGVVGGPVVQQTCNFGPSQLWAVFNHILGRWE